jgi:hypothetical protein
MISSILLRTYLAAFGPQAVRLHQFITRLFVVLENSDPEGIGLCVLIRGLEPRDLQVKCTARSIRA